ncbi:MAG: L-rhamnose isomerase [Clostridiales bacterium]|jgi:L-rhamnose isomerase|nr:L-rhamnose isomerase [Clostridiales bacterium]
MKSETILKRYESAKEVYKDFGVDTEAALKKLKDIKISLHCWQGDDIRGFEADVVASENVVTGNYPYAARTPDELRADIEFVLGLDPGGHKVNLHGVYGEKPQRRDEQNIDAFSNWIDWAKQNKLGLDYNGSFFAHKMMDKGLSLTSPNKDVRDFWIRYGKATREIAAGLGKATGQISVCNLWIPDGLKDNPADRLYYRSLLKESLDAVFAKKFDKKQLLDTVEGKLFGIGTECFVAGSYDFYLTYAAKNNLGICLDSGHYHVGESIADKFSALAPFGMDILLHISRGERWDSDHVVTYNDTLTSIMTEAKRAGVLESIHIGLDYFDASINRTIAWATGLRNASRALLNALLEPTDLLKKAERDGDFSMRLALSEEAKMLPVADVWNYACLSAGIPVGGAYTAALAKYENDVLKKR